MDAPITPHIPRRFAHNSERNVTTAGHRSLLGSSFEGSEDFSRDLQEDDPPLDFQSAPPFVPADSQVNLSEASGDGLLIYVDPAKSNRSQGSFVTILSMWTTMMGSSLLVMPWAIQEAGFALGLCLVLVMGVLTFFPTTLIYKCANYLESVIGKPVIEFQDICCELLGVRLSWISLLISLLNLIGAMVVYWILMSAMLYQIGCFVYETRYPDPANVTAPSAAISSTGLFSEYWNEVVTVPFYLVFLLLPLICLKKPTFFTKFSSFGIVSILFIIIFVTIKVWSWGFHVTETAPGFQLYNKHFPALSGTLSMGFFIHNCILSMTAHHRQPQHKSRDTGIAFVMVALSYAFVGGCYYAAYPGDKHRIADNFLKDFSNREVLALGARCLLLFQMITVFPLLAYLFRVQFFYGVFGRLDISHHFVIILNVILIGTCLVFSTLYPRIGDILRILGSICGLVYVFTLPLLMDLVVAKRTGQQSIWRTGFYSILMMLGWSNFIAQFVIPLHPNGTESSLSP